MKDEPKVQEHLAEPIRKMILEEPFFGYRTLAVLAWAQQEHGAEDLPAQRLAGQEAVCRVPTQGAGVAVSGHGTRPQPICAVS